MRDVKSKMLIVLLIIGWLGGSAAVHAQIITLVVRGGTSTNDPPIIAPNSLNEDELCFVDRQHEYNAIPAPLPGAEYVMVANEDKTQADYSLDVELVEPARLYLFLDNRLGHGDIPGGDPNLNPDLWSAGMDWVYNLGFADTGLNIGIDEGGDGQINQWSSVYVKNVQPGLITLGQQNDRTDPEGRNMYGVAALKWGWFRPFWFLNARVKLVQTDDWVTIPTGFWGGWFWWQYQGQWLRPYQGPLWWYQPYCEEYPYWAYWDYWPYYKRNKPWWHYWQWQGWPYFWGFTDSLTFRYASWKPRIVYFWSYYWDPGGQGNCLELIAGDGGEGPPARISPLSQDVIDNLEVQSHQFSVHGGKVRGDLSRLEFIRTWQLEAHFRSLPSVTEADVQGFMSSDIVQRLFADDPPEDSFIGVQHAQWDHPVSPLVCTTESLEISEGETVGYGVRLREQPAGPVTVNVVSSDPENIKWVDYDEDVFQLHFGPDNWDEFQPVTVIITDPWHGPEPFWLSHSPVDYPHEGSVLPITVQDVKTGGRGYLMADINRDTKTNFKDVALVAAKWLESTEAPPEIDIWSPDVMVSQDIGTEGGRASFDPETETWDVTGDGADIWGRSDQFHFVYKVVGYMDFQMTATVLSLDDTHVEAKAGIMIRDEPEPDSAYSMIAVTPQRGVVFQVRYESGEITESTHGGPAAHLKPPISLRLVTIGPTVEGYYYGDGRWIKLGATTKRCKCFDDNTGYIGMAVTSHNPDTMTTATFGKELVGFEGPPGT